MVTASLCSSASAVEPLISRQAQVTLAAIVRIDAMANSRSELGMIRSPFHGGIELAPVNQAAKPTRSVAPTPSTIRAVADVRRPAPVLVPCMAGV